jgi:hypothetical protein
MRLSGGDMRITNSNELVSPLSPLSNSKLPYPLSVRTRWDPKKKSRNLVSAKISRKLLVSNPGPNTKPTTLTGARIPSPSRLNNFPISFLSSSSVLSYDVFRINQSFSINVGRLFT